MSFSDISYGYLLLAVSVMLVILPAEVQFNYVNFKEYQALDHTAQVKINIL